MTSDRRIETVSGGTTTRYVYAGLDHPLARIAASGTAYYHADGLGSVVATSNAAGAITASARYGAFGRTLAQTGGIPRYGYAGREPDATGLIYYRARYYDPSLGRFAQRDPAGFADGINPYAYVGNNPISFSDPLGLSKMAPVTVPASSYVGSGNSSSGLSMASLRNIASGIADSATKLWNDQLAATRNESLSSFVFDKALPGMGPEVDALPMLAMGVIGKIGTVGEAFFEGTSLHPRVLKQLESADNHAFPVLIDELAASYGSVVKTVDSRGKPVEMLTLEGIRNGVQGTYEYIKNSSNQIYHRFFNPSK